MASENLNLNANWKLCANWLHDCESLPKPLIIKLYQDQLTLNELACALRDGVVLCNLLDYLKPGSINLSQVNKQQNLGETLSLENIKLFLDTCKEKFKMKESELFPPDTLFNLNMESVFQTLSALSKSDEAAERCNGGFHLAFNDNEPENSSLYFSLANNYIDTNDYISFDFYFDDETQDIYDKIMNVSEAIGHKNKPRDADYVIREIILTEERHINIMKEYEKHFIRQLSTLLDPEDQRLIAMDFGFLINFHESFLAQLKETCRVNDSRTNSICDVFIDFKRKFMTNYTNYILNLPNAVNRFNNLINENPKFKKKIEECMNKSSNTSLKLTDYLTMPFQRVSKYHLLLESLYKKFDGDKEKKKEKIKQVWLSFKEVGLYLNEISRDQDSIIYIEKVMKNLNVKLPYGKTFKDFGRLIREDKIRIKLKNNINEVARTRTVFLFQTCLIILKKNLFGSYTHFASISIYDIVFNDPSDKNKKNSLNNNFKSLKVDEACLELMDTQISYTYEFYFTDVNQKNLWIDKFKEAKPIDSNLTTNSHLFRLSNFGAEIVECDSCKQSINGIFFQGYKCNYCFQRVHNKCLCLTKAGKCPYDGRIRDSLNNGNNRKTINEKIESIKNNFNRLSNSLSSNSSSTLSNSNVNLTSTDYIIPNLNEEGSTKEKENMINYCKSTYLYNGNPKPPYENSNILYFEPGELIQILDSDDDVWWKGSKIEFKCQRADNGEKIYKSEGYFPRSHVKLLTRNEYSNELTNYSWYLEGERDLADAILKQISTSETIFLVRYNPKAASYAISFKFQNCIYHIKIESKLFDQNSTKQVEFTSNNNEILFYYQITQTNLYVNNSNNIDSLNNETILYSIDSFRKCFTSIENLLAFYTIKVLKENEFPDDYDTTLGRPYRDYFNLPKFKVVPNSNFKLNSYEFRTSKAYFVIEEKNDHYRLFDKNGYTANAPKNAFKII